jgi:hypothetical protein
MHCENLVSRSSRLRLVVALGVAEPPTEATPLPSSDFEQAAAVTSKSGSRQTARTRFLIRDLLRSVSPVEQRTSNSPVTASVTPV